MTKKIKIMVVNPFAQATSGNDEVMTRLMAKMDKSLFEFVVVQPAESRYSEIYKDLGATVETISMSIIRRDLSPKFVTGYFLNFAPTIARFVKLIMRHKVDIVHTNTTQILGAGAGAKIRGLPSIYHVHSISIEKPEWVIKPMTYWIDKTSDVLIANSRASKEVFVKRGFPEDKVRIIHNPIEIEKYDSAHARDAARKELGIGDNEPLIGIVARIARVKSLELFIESAAIVLKSYPSARFAIVGGAHGEENELYLEELKALAQKLGIADKVIFVGRRDDIPRIVSAFDIGALTSRSEGFGLALVEFMAVGKPVVGTAVGGVLDIITDGVDGYLVPYGDANAIARAFLKLLSSPSRAREMGKMAKQKVETFFDARALAEKLQGIYLSVHKH